MKDPLNLVFKTSKMCTCKHSFGKISHYWDAQKHMKPIKNSELSVGLSTKGCLCSGAIHWPLVQGGTPPCKPSLHALLLLEKQMVKCTSWPRLCNISQDVTKISQNYSFCVLVLVMSDINNIKIEAVGLM